MRGVLPCVPITMMFSDMDDDWPRAVYHKLALNRAEVTVLPATPPIFRYRCV